MTHVNSYRGYSLFNDIEDYALRIRNRAVVMCNMAETHAKKGLISPKGAALILGYFNGIQEDERPDTMNKFKYAMQERGFSLT